MPMYRQSEGETTEKRPDAQQLVSFCCFKSNVVVDGMMAAVEKQLLTFRQ